MLRSGSRKFWKVGVVSRKFWKGRSRCRIFYLRLRYPVSNYQCYRKKYWRPRSIAKVNTNGWKLNVSPVQKIRKCLNSSGLVRTPEYTWSFYRKWNEVEAKTTYDLQLSLSFLLEGQRANGNHAQTFNSSRADKTK